MSNDTTKSLNQLFIDSLDKKLEKYTSCIKREDQLDRDQVTTYLYDYFIIDVVGDECALTIKGEKGVNNVYVFYIDDYKEVIDEIINQIKQCNE